MAYEVINADVREGMIELFTRGMVKSFQSIITSPPYFGLRDYGVDGQLGGEETLSEYIDNLVSIFGTARELLADDGTLWINIGDSYAGSRRGMHPKNLLGIPWRLALALQADGWILRQEIIWHKPNPMPAPLRDRFVTAHEYIFLLSKKPKYYFDWKAVSEPAKYAGDRRGERKDARRGTRANAMHGSTGDTRRKRNVWSVPSHGYHGSHLAAFPPHLILPCVIASCPVGGYILDPFSGCGTTLGVAQAMGCNAYGIELNKTYAQETPKRIHQISELFDTEYIKRVQPCLF